MAAGELWGWCCEALMWAGLWGAAPAWAAGRLWEWALPRKWAQPWGQAGGAREAIDLIKLEAGAGRHERCSAQWRRM